MFIWSLSKYFMLLKFKAKNSLNDLTSIDYHVNMKYDTLIYLHKKKLSFNEDKK